MGKLQLNKSRDKLCANRNVASSPRKMVILRYYWIKLTSNKDECAG